ncbi:hypothetical protein [Herbaspirillum sp. ST 5-3]|uniref:hypothetical protein n=1 Tax=Oxalobacteraceae TaxID=75682 RepID=UPI0010A40637|nr:hypothetical protein [Herbaspirillum sp. ST 5-3]
MTDYLAKPIRGRALLDTIDALMRGATNLTATATPREASYAPCMPQAFDPDEALATVEGATDDLRTLARLMLEQINIELPAIRQLVFNLGSEECGIEIQNSAGCALPDHG